MKSIDILALASYKYTSDPVKSFLVLLKLLTPEQNSLSQATMKTTTILAASAVIAGALVDIAHGAPYRKVDANSEYVKDGEINVEPSSAYQPSSTYQSPSTYESSSDNQIVHYPQEWEDYNLPNTMEQGPKVAHLIEYAMREILNAFSGAVNPRPAESHVHDNQPDADLEAVYEWDKTEEQQDQRDDNDCTYKHGEKKKRATDDGINTYIYVNPKDPKGPLVNAWGRTEEEQDEFDADDANYGDNQVENESSTGDKATTSGDIDDYIYINAMDPKGPPVNAWGRTEEEQDEFDADDANYEDQGEPEGSLGDKVTSGDIDDYIYYKPGDPTQEPVNAWGRTEWEQEEYDADDANYKRGVKKRGELHSRHHHKDKNRPLDETEAMIAFVTHPETSKYANINDLQLQKEFEEELQEDHDASDDNYKHGEEKKRDEFTIIVESDVDADDDDEKRRFHDVVETLMDYIMDPAPASASPDSTAEGAQSQEETGQEAQDEHGEQSISEPETESSDDISFLGPRPSPVGVNKKPGDKKVGDKYDQLWRKYIDPLWADLNKKGQRVKQLKKQNASRSINGAGPEPELGSDLDSHHHHHLTTRGLSQISEYIHHLFFPPKDEEAQKEQEKEDEATNNKEDIKDYVKDCIKKMYHKGIEAENAKRAEQGKGELDIGTDNRDEDKQWILHFIKEGIEADKKEKKAAKEAAKAQKQQEEQEGQEQEGQHEQQGQEQQPEKSKSNSKRDDDDDTSSSSSSSTVSFWKKILTAIQNMDQEPGYPAELVDKMAASIDRVKFKLQLEEWCKMGMDAENKERKAMGLPALQPVTFTNGEDEAWFVRWVEKGMEVDEGWENKEGKGFPGKKEILAGLHLS